MPKLRPYQFEAVKDILDKKKILLADDMGLGKCAESIMAMNLIEKRQGYDGKTLIVCPNSVRQHWEEEIKKWYKKGEQTNISHIETSSYEGDIKKAEGSDFSIIGYSTLSHFGGSGSKISSLQDLGFQYGIVDEAHNAKNPDSIRSLAAKKLFDSMNYLAILSGTPIPNTVSDIYMLLSLLDKEHFPLVTENPKAVLTNFYNLFKQDPEFVRRVLNERMLRRTVEDYLGASVPKAKVHNLEVKLDGEHRDTYLQVYENHDIHPGAKLIQLRKAALDPNLVAPKFLNGLSSRVGRMESSVYNSLDGLVEEVADKNGKLLVFTDFKEGVTEKLRERYKKYGALVIDGDVSSSNINGEVSLREEIRKKFQKNPNHKLLIATTVMDEGVDLTAATDVAHLTLPYTPAAFDQRNRRAQRIGEVMKDSVNIHILKSSLGDTPTISEGVERLLEDKRRIITYIMKQPFSLTKDDLDEIKNGHAEKSRFLAPLIRSPMQSIMSHLGQLKGKGHKKVLQHYKKYPEEAECIAKLYSSHWDGYYGGNTANLYTKIINTLEENASLERKLDLASGPFSLSRRLKQPVVSLDINSQMLQAGKMLENEGKIAGKNNAVQGSFHQLPFKDNSFDLALCSLALHMSTPKKRKNEKFSERELVLRGINASLKENGYGIITLPHTLIEEGDLTRFYGGLNQLGFEVLPFSGFYKGPEDSHFKVYLAGLKKISKPTKDALNEDALLWKMDRKSRDSRRSSSSGKNHTIPESREIKQEFVTNFFNVRTKQGLEECVTSNFR